jgi:hypothetical protein
VKFIFPNTAALWSVVAFSLLACTDRDLADHAPDAKLRSITMERRANTSEDWTVASRMDYQYDSLGHEVGKAFYQQGPADTLALALQYHIELPDSFTRIEVRKDCGLDSCRVDSRRVWVKDLHGEDFTDSTFQWDSNLSLWRIYYVQKHSRDSLRQTDTLWQEELGHARNRIVSNLQANSRVVEMQAIDSMGQWFMVQRETCRMQGKLPVYCKAGLSESWITYTSFDSIAVQRFKSPAGYSSIQRDYDSHGHWIRTNYSDTSRTLRIYQ